MSTNGVKIRMNQMLLADDLYITNDRLKREAVWTGE